MSDLWGVLVGGALSLCGTLAANWQQNKRESRARDAEALAELRIFRRKTYLDFCGKAIEAQRQTNPELIHTLRALNDLEELIAMMATKPVREAAAEYARILYQSKHQDLSFGDLHAKRQLFYAAVRHENGVRD